MEKKLEIRGEGAIESLKVNQNWTECQRLRQFPKPESGSASRPLVHRWIRNERV
jgi:hypothetical protein